MSKLLLAGLLLPFFASCSAMKSVKETAAATAAKATEKVKYFSINDLRPSSVGVVEVREKDLQEMPLGKERALAFDQKRKRSFWSFLPGTFEEPTLPVVDESGIDGSLLPPKEL